MSYRLEKDTGDLVIDGFEQGIASSPHKGIANIQNGNISTENGEVTASFVRTQQSMTSTATGTGTLTFVDSSHVNLNISGSNNLFKGQWITVTASSNTTQLPNGTYYVQPSTGSGYVLSNYYNSLVPSGALPVTSSYLIVGGGGNGGNGATTNNGGGGGGGGQVRTGTTSLNVGTNAITVGAANSTSSAFSITAAAGVNGVAPANGASAGGAGGASGSGNAGGAAGSGNVGGPNVGGGGGGDSAVGLLKDGGAGTVSSITGISLTYGGGGGAGAQASPGNGGAGGGGAGGTTNGTAGSGNTGGGGGGGNNGGTGAGGGTGLVVVSYPVGSLIGATGGTISYFGTNKIHTFTSSGSLVIPTQPTANLTGFLAGLTATIQLVATMGNPLAQATESYFRSGTKYNRYYVLDSNNLVWVYDTYNEVLYSASDNVNWFLPDYQTSWCTGATGLGVISGFLVAAAKTGLYGKPTDLLGNTNSTATTWTQFTNVSGWSSGALNSPHYVFTGHQGRMYITDGNYIASVFPESTLANTNISSQNIQSFCSWIIYSAGANPQYDGQFSVIAGTSPIPGTAARIPVVLFTNSAGTLPTSITAGKVYYMSANLTYFNVYPDPLITSAGTIVFTGAPASGATGGTLTAAWSFATGAYPVTFSNGDVRQVTLTNGSTSATWSVGLSSSPTVNADYIGELDLQTGASGTQYFNTFYPIASAPSYLGATPTYLYTPQRLTLPSFEIAQTIGEIGNIALIGCNGNVVYPWDQASSLPTNLIPLPEGNVANIITVNSMAYIFAGNNGNVYITDGGTSSLVINIPDYCAGVPGSPGTYIESTYYWGGAMYLRGRVYFSVRDQSTTKAGNCGGIWSFVPTQNLYIGQDTGIALRMEAQNSYNTYSGAASLLIGKQLQDQEAPLYWSAWYSDYNTPTYGIDYSTNGTSASFPTVVETDAIPAGTMLNKKTFSQLEYKLSSPLDNGATVTAFYRTNLTDSWTACSAFNVESSGLSGYAVVNFEKNQWLQFKFVLTPITSTAASNSFIRFKEIRLR